MSGPNGKSGSGQNKQSNYKVHNQYGASQRVYAAHNSDPLRIAAGMASSVGLVQVRTVLGVFQIPPPFFRKSYFLNFQIYTENDQKMIIFTASERFMSEKISSYFL